MTDPARPAPGDVFELADQHYKFGAGPLVCRVVEVFDAIDVEGLVWWFLRVDCKAGTLGTVGAHPGGWYRRELYLDARVVRSARRRAGPRNAPAPRADQRRAPPQGPDRLLRAM